MSLQPVQPPLPDISEARPSAPAVLVDWAAAAQAAHQLAVPLCRTEFVPQHFRGNEAAATAAILYGAEAGLSPMQALQGIFVIGGRPALYVRTMLALTLAAGHEVNTVESTDARAVVEARRRGSSHTERVVVTIDQARRAGWTSNKKYASEPASMLLARAQSQACRRVAPDALHGLAYSAEELQDEHGTAPAEPKRAARRKLAAEQPAPPEPDHDVPAQDEPDGEGPSDGQMRRLHALVRECGAVEREAALELVSDAVGRQVTSSSELTREEASRVIDNLERLVGGPEPEVES